ncbi:MAG: hypothetical protein WD597_08965, partial [Balneolaceae bacterium]
KLKFILPPFILLFIFSAHTFSQEIDFESYSSRYSVTASHLNPAEELEFGLILVNEGLRTIPIADAKIITIEGIKYLDVTVEIIADEYLLLNGDLGCVTNASCRIAFNLEAAYTNRGPENINHANLMTTAGNSALARFPIEQRGNEPPGPPPTPVYEGYDLAAQMRTAYLYIYGSINVGNIDAGIYSANITVNISYD